MTVGRQGRPSSPSELRAMYAAPTDESYWDASRARILARVSARRATCRDGGPRMADLARPALAAAAILDLRRRRRRDALAPARSQRGVHQRHLCLAAVHRDGSAQRIRRRRRCGDRLRPVPLRSSCRDPNSRRSRFSSVRCSSAERSASRPIASSVATTDAGGATRRVLRGHRAHATRSSASMDSILDARNCKMDSVVKTIQPTLDSIKTASRAEMDRILTPEQHAKIEVRRKDDARSPRLPTINASSPPAASDPLTHLPERARARSSFRSRSPRSPPTRSPRAPSRSRKRSRWRSRTRSAPCRRAGRSATRSPACAPRAPRCSPASTSRSAR